MTAEDAGGETPQLPVQRRTFTIDWLDGTNTTRYENVIGSGMMPEVRMLVLHHEDGSEHWFNVDAMSSIYWEEQADDDG